MNSSFLSRGVVAILSIGAMVATLCSVPMPSARGDEPLGGDTSATLGREPQLAPTQLGDGSIDGLQFADPTEGLALVDPPAASNDGGVHLSYPLLIPAGRGITPDLSLGYDSGAGNGWVGQGWDLSVGEIAVDTRWGAPYFDADRESESYTIDGEPMLPNALGDAWEPRVRGDRQDYTRQVETSFAQIIRHEAADGGPKNYFWEVHDKGGNVFWYGGAPDEGGPDGYATGAPTIDRSAIVTDTAGHGVRWLLSAQRDIGVNQVSYHYTTLHYANSGSGWNRQASCTDTGTTLCARHTYLTAIDYTEAADRAPAPDGDAPYRISFKLESEVFPSGAVRPDPVVDAMGGYVDLVADRLSRVEVHHGAARPVVDADGHPVLDADGAQVRGPRTYDQLAVAYALSYSTGAFGKSLLRGVSQVGSDNTSKAEHSFRYSDRVRDAAGTYTGFGEPTDWNTGADLPDRQFIDSQAAIGALGSSESNSGEGHAYLGFNPLIPDKVGSFGGALQLGGGATEAIAEWLDVNGDGLPDKVYRDPDDSGDPDDILRNGPIRYRLNTSGPAGGTTFGPERTVLGITRLSTEGNFGIEGAFMAYPGVNIAFGISGEVSWGDAYFSDVNGDGLPDYVSGGSVFFNHLAPTGPPPSNPAAATRWSPSPTASPPSTRLPSSRTSATSWPPRTRWSTPCVDGSRPSRAPSASPPPWRWHRAAPVPRTTASAWPSRWTAPSAPRPTCCPPPIRPSPHRCPWPSPRERGSTSASAPSTAARTTK